MHVLIDRLDNNGWARDCRLQRYKGARAKSDVRWNMVAPRPWCWTSGLAKQRKRSDRMDTALTRYVEQRSIGLRARPLSLLVSGYERHAALSVSHEQGLAGMAELRYGWARQPLGQGAFI